MKKRGIIAPLHTSCKKMVGSCPTLMVEENLHLNEEQATFTKIPTYIFAGCPEVPLYLGLQAQ